VQVIFRKEATHTAFAYPDVESG